MVVMSTVQLITYLLPFIQHALNEVLLIRTRFIYDLPIPSQQYHHSVVVQIVPQFVGTADLF